jgi:mRNA-degrading endonuclease toxin of MazEF toxin-antitoxin module
VTVPKPGEIYFADYEDLEPHRVIIVSQEGFNRGKYATVVVCTSKKFRERARLRNCVVFRAGEYGFTEDCVAQGETVSFIGIKDLHLTDGPMATLDGEAMRNVIKAVGYVMGSDCEPE